MLGKRRRRYQSWSISEWYTVPRQSVTVKVLRLDVPLGSLAEDLDHAGIVVGLIAGGGERRCSDPARHVADDDAECADHHAGQQNRAEDATARQQQANARNDLGDPRNRKKVLSRPIAWNC